MIQLHDRIEAALGLRPENIRSMHGGMIGEVYRVDLPGEDCIVAKVADPSDGTLDIEGYMLDYLKEHSNLPVPEVLHCEKTLLLMSFIAGDSNLDSSTQHHAAELLADLHTVRAPQFGLERDTLIGPLHQPNPWTDSWVAFFRDQRLLHMARETHREDALPDTMMARIEKLAGNLDRWLIEPEYPSLIHGDVWTTNVLSVDGRVTGFVDPAIYYANAEMELAYTTLFGTFGAAFFERYRSIRSIEPGFMEVRRDIYNLYPLLVHVRLFGAGYIGSVDGILRRLGF